MMKRGAAEVKKKRKSDKKLGGGTEEKKKKKKVEKGKKEKNVKKGKNRKAKKSKREKGKLKKGKKKKNGKRRNGGKGKKKKKTGKNKSKGKKRNKNKIKRKRKKMRGRKDKKKRKEKGNARQTSTAACSNLTCLTALVSVLKFEKDTVRNFLAQEKRTNSKLLLMQNKQNRSDKYMGTAKFLEKRLGETSAHKSDGPLCKGSYNTSEGIKVRKFVYFSRFFWSSNRPTSDHFRLAKLLTGWKIANRRSTRHVPPTRTSTPARRSC